ncbi:MAG: nucleotidyltransferase domain-containing protein [Candidatus Wildermuthbacteria bacterium]|nr:nucleotidyltransferase domain-containing protein [Candidatus Wildermuthbacteria bacterium]
MELIEKQRKKLQEIAQRYELELVLLFGSRVKGKLHKESDYDVAYISRQDLDLEEEGKLITDLLLIIHPSDERLINLVNVRKATALLLYDMTSRCRVLYERTPGIFARLQAYAFKKYVESKPLYEAKFLRLGRIIKSYDI